MGSALSTRKLAIGRGVIRRGVIRRLARRHSVTIGTPPNRAAVAAFNDAKRRKRNASGFVVAYKHPAQ